MRNHTLDNVLRIDAGANVLAGIGLLAFGGLLATPLGLDASWPVRVLGLVLVAYGIENQLVARRTTATGLIGLIAVDLVFAVAVLAMAIADPAGAETWARWALVGVADLSAVMGITKVLGLRSLSTAPDARSVTA